ncbi:MAG: hypothetical protein M5U26_08235 [Planctomycetota bacterium]|nr:hypothetical protein [Planctomycetota bacterium]
MPWDRHLLHDRAYCMRIWFGLTAGTPRVRELRAAFAADVFDFAPTWLRPLARRAGETDAEYAQRRRQAMASALRRTAGDVRLRVRACDEELANRKAKLANWALSYIAEIERHDTTRLPAELRAKFRNTKGAGKPRAWMDLLATILGCWDEPEFQAQAEALYGAQLSALTFERIFRAHFGGLSPVERAMDAYFQRTEGLLPEYAGQIVQMDGSELPVHVLQGWGRARKDGKIDRVFAALTDCASLRTWLRCEGTRSEVYLWSPLLIRFFEETGFAPELIMGDEGGRGFASLRHQKPGEPLSLEPGIRLALLAGAAPHTHTPGLARTKGSVEAGGIKSTKSTVKRVLVRRFVSALLRELKSATPGIVPRDYRLIESEAAWTEIFGEVEGALNARCVRRAADGHWSRAQIWAHDAFAEARSRRALAAGWQERWQGLVAQGVAMRLRGQRQLSLKQTRAELRTVLPAGRARRLRGRRLPRRAARVRRRARRRSRTPDARGRDPAPARRRPAPLSRRRGHAPQGNLDRLRAAPREGWRAPDRAPAGRTREARQGLGRSALAPRSTQDRNRRRPGRRRRANHQPRLRRGTMHHSDQAMPRTLAHEENLSKQFGPTGKFPGGKLNEVDQGEIRFGVGADQSHNLVRLDFGKGVRWICLSRNQALDLGHSIIEEALKLKP